MHFLFNPNGRFRRWQYWTVQSLILAIFVPACLGLKNAYDPTDPPLPDTIVFGGFIVATGMILLLWCRICSIIKRYHDRGKSGWWALILFIPIIGWLWQAFECGFLASDPRYNEYGPGPEADGGVEEEIRQLKASQGYGLSPPLSELKPALYNNAAFPARSKPMFGQDSRP